MRKRIPGLLLAALWAAPLVFGQGLQTTATRDDWEEVNFEFNSPVLSDGYPSLLRMAELLVTNSKGASAKAVITVRLVVTRIP